MSAASQGGGAGGCEVTPEGRGTVWVSLGGVCVHMRVCLRRPHGGWLSAQQAVWQMVEPRPPRGCEPPGAAAFSALTSPMSVSGEPAGKGQRQGHQGADATAAGSVPTGWPWLGSNSSQADRHGALEQGPSAPPGPEVGGLWVPCSKAPFGRSFFETTSPCCSRDTNRPWGEQLGRCPALRGEAGKLSAVVTLA